MRFEYEITVDDFVASQILYNRLRRAGHQIRLRENPIVWIVFGAFAIAVAWNERRVDWGPILLAATGAWFLYAGLVGLFPAPYFRRTYRGAELWGEKFAAEVDNEGFKVVADLCSWQIPWRGVKLRGENDRVFVFYSANTLFIFGKRYLNESQQEEIRKLSGIGDSINQPTEAAS